MKPKKTIHVESAGPSRDDFETLSLANKYMLSIEKMGSEFRLPREHVRVQTLLEDYSYDLPGWMKFVKTARDNMGRGSPGWADMQELFRTIETRCVQRIRWARLDAAISVALKKGLIPDTPEAKIAYAKRCTQVWMARKKNLENVHRADSSNGRITQALREELLAEFWKQIDDEIKNGEVLKL